MASSASLARHRVLSLTAPLSRVFLSPAASRRSPAVRACSRSPLEQPERSRSFEASLQRVGAGRMPGKLGIRFASSGAAQRKSRAGDAKSTQVVPHLFRTPAVGSARLSCRRAV